MGIIAGLGRGMPGRPGAPPPPSRAAAGRGGRWSPAAGGGVPSAAAAAGGADGRRPMPWLDANGLLPGRGAPGRPTGRGAGAFGVASDEAAAAGASGSAGGSGAGAGFASGSGSGVGAASGSTGAGRGFGLLGRGLGAGLGGRRLLGRGSLGRRSGLQLLAVLLLETHLDRGFDRRRRRLDELPHLLELLENKLALDTELFGEFVDSGLSHASPSGPSPELRLVGGGDSDR